MTAEGDKKISVKICGITTLEDALLATELGCDALGFNFVSSSKRRVTPETVKSIIRHLPEEMMMVGIFQDLESEKLIRLIEETGLNAAQMHGSESFSDCQFIAQRVPTTIKALTPNAPELSRFLDFGVDYLLLDSDNPGQGESFDWSAKHDLSFSDRMFLAGGLSLENLDEGIAAFSPFGVDVASGVESFPGVKDPNLLKLFIQRAKSIS